MKTHNIIFWITTSLIFIMKGIIPALNSHSELAKECLLLGAILKK